MISGHTCVTADIGCPVLMCDTFRMVAKRNQMAKVNETSSRVPASSTTRRAGPKAAQPVSSSWNKCSPNWWPVLRGIVLNSLELISAQTPAIHIYLKCSSLSLALAFKEYGIKCQEFMLNEMTKYKFLFMFCSNGLMLFTILKYNSYELFHFTI